MSDTTVIEERDDRGVVTLTLNRPDIRNAFDPEVMQAIRDRFDALDADTDLRCVVLTGAGSAFSAGANLNWMRSMRDYSLDENVADSRQLDALFRTIDAFPAPVVARVNGHALGGAMGLIACADIAVAARGAKFGFTETRLGIAPAVISTYVLPRIGMSNARRLFLTGEVFDADRAARIGLVHEVCEPEDLDTVTAEVVGAILAAGPAAQRAMKALLRRVDAALPDQQAAADETVQVISRLRMSEEGQEGMAAFFEKRGPAWAPAGD